MERTRKEGTEAETPAPVPAPTPAPHPVLALQAGAGNQATTRTLSRLFISAPEKGTRKVASVADIMAMDTDKALQRLIAGRLGEAGRTLEDKTRYGLRKLAEGPSIEFKDKADLTEKVTARLNAIAPTPAGSAVKSRQRRKLNRITGQIDSKGYRLFTTKTDAKKLLPTFRPVYDAVRVGEAARSPQKVLELCGTCLDTLSAQLEATSPKGMWLAYDAVSSFGPLGHALVGADTGALQALHTKNLATLRDIRARMARRENVTVVAHRGTGPTNRTMGGLISQADQRRLNRPAENSPEAFKAALAETTGADGEEEAVPKLDGIECDVFLSRDGVPMLSHEGAVLEQLSTRQAQLNRHLNKGTHVKDLNAADLKRVQRTDKGDSRFMTLQELIDMTVPLAAKYHEATGLPLRLEIEMKGTKEDKSFAARTDGRSPLTGAVAKVVSQSIKRSGGAAIEYILFNNNAGEVEAFDKLRTTKSALGGLYTGLGAGDSTAFDKKWLDELRYQFTAVGAAKHNLTQHGVGDERGKTVLADLLKDYLVTLVYGQEFAPQDHPDYASKLAAQEPSHEVSYGDRGSSGHVRFAKGKRAAGESGPEEVIEDFLVWYKQSGGSIQNLHILTDFPAKASWLKGKLGPPPAEVEDEVVEDVDDTVPEAEDETEPEVVAAPVAAPIGMSKSAKRRRRRKKGGAAPGTTSRR